MSSEACKSFREDTGFDLQTVFLEHISTWYESKTLGLSSIKETISLSKLYGRELACKALHCMIIQKDDKIPMSEIEDATFRVSWLNPAEGD